MAHRDEVCQEGAVGKAKLGGRRGTGYRHQTSRTRMQRGCQWHQQRQRPQVLADDTNVGFHLLEKSGVVGKCPSEDKGTDGQEKRGVLTFRESVWIAHGTLDHVDAC